MSPIGSMPGELLSVMSCSSRLESQMKSVQRSVDRNRQDSHALAAGVVVPRMRQHPPSTRRSATLKFVDNTGPK